MDLRYPIGNFERGVAVTPELKERFIREVAELPVKLRAAVEGLGEEQLKSPYRPGGWTVRQTVHHVADSHINAVIRFKLALTEDVPTIKPYHEARWAELSDSKLPVGISLQILDGLHQRWVNFLHSMPGEDYGRKLIHPDSGEWTLEEFLALYAWHGRHHTAHITKLRERNDW